ncbi:unnamed protein product, partial [Adineta ricciae]
SLTLPRAYIGARRKRQYLNNYSTSTSLANETRFSNENPSKAFQLNQSSEDNDLLNVEITDTLQTQQEEQALLEHLSSSTSADERQLHQHRQEEAKGFSPLPASSSSSRFLFPTIHDVTLLSHSNHSPPSSLPKEKQHFYDHHLLSHPYEPHSCQKPLSSENKNNQLLLLEEYQQRKEEQQKHKQSLANSLSIHNQNVELSNIPEEKNSFSSLYALSDPIVEHNDNDNQSHLFTST